MFCFKCGNELREGAKFCTKCGSSQDRSGGISIERAEKKIDRVVDNLGHSIDNAVEDIRDNAFNRSDYNQTSQFRSDDSSPKNNNGLFTVSNMEKLIAVSLFIPLLSLIIGFVLGLPVGLGGVIGRIFDVLQIVVKVLFALTEVAALVAIIYVVVTCDIKRNAFSVVTLTCVCLNILIGSVTVIRSMTNYGYVEPVIRNVALVINLVGIIWGIDLFSRIILQCMGIESTPDVKTDIAEYGTFISRIKSSTESEERETELAIVHNPSEASYFDGTGLQLFGNMLLFVLVSAITFGIGTPWMLCRLLRWRKSHTVINGRRLAFTGTGGGLLGRWILWTILSIVTCGIFALVEYVFLLRWEMENTRYADESNTNGRFDGEWASYIGYGVMQGALLSVTCGLAWPWTSTMIMKWEMKHSIVGRDRMKYDGTALGFLGTYLVVWFLSLITLGIYGCWGVCKLNRYTYSHTHIDDSERI